MVVMYFTPYGDVATPKKIEKTLYSELNDVGLKFHITMTLPTQ